MRLFLKITLLLFAFVCLQANARIFDKSRFTYRVGISSNSFMHPVWDDYIENLDYDVSLSERYGPYHGKIYVIPPLSFDADYKVFKWLDLSGGLSWVCMWGNVYSSYNVPSYNYDVVVSNSLYLIPSLKFNFFNVEDCTIYLTAGYGLGLHLNRSDSHPVGYDFHYAHSNYLLDKGKNSVSGQIEIVGGIRIKRMFLEMGNGSRYLGVGGRIGMELKF
ncbi:MAG: hypothetical protein IK038_07710 [Bacteroidaceae bacterium]|nr:hypothetical protein [Bacteroidaceae bacterium]